MSIQQDQSSGEPLREAFKLPSPLPVSVAEHADFVQAMLDRLHLQQIPDGPHRNQRPLASLTDRALSDSTIALIHAWAAACDVLSFYNQRIADEGYLDSAVQLRSAQQLVQATGYDRSPGAAASTELAFVVDDSDPSTAAVEIPAGTQVQSVPGQDEDLQSFETSTPLDARAVWNELQIDRSQLIESQRVDPLATSIRLEGRHKRLKAGEVLLFVDREAVSRWAAVTIRQVRFGDEPSTIVSWAKDDVVSPSNDFSMEHPWVVCFRQQMELFGRMAADWKSLPDPVKATMGASQFALSFEGIPVRCWGLPPANIHDLVESSQGYLYAATHRGVYRTKEAFAPVRATEHGIAWVDVSETLANKEVYSCTLDANEAVYAGTSHGGVFRQLAGSDHWTALGPLLESRKVKNVTDPVEFPIGPVISMYGCQGGVVAEGAGGVDQRFRIHDDGSVVNEPESPAPLRLPRYNLTVNAFAGFEESDWPGYSLDDTLPLDGKLADLSPEDWILVVDDRRRKQHAVGDPESPPSIGQPPWCRPLKPRHVMPGRQKAFGLAGEVTRVIPEDPMEQSLAAELLRDVDRRTSSVWVKSELLTPSQTQRPQVSRLHGDRLLLAEPADGLAKGRRLLVSGQGRPAGDPQAADEEVAEVVTIASTPTLGNREIELTAALAFDYVPDSVRINANVVAATHGETVHAEVLGSGDGDRTFQRFRLRRGPLTYVLDERTGRPRSTLTVEVSGVRWDQVPTLIHQAPFARSYTVRHDHQGNAMVIFGDGRTGARLPTDVENVVASYRVGVGVAGNLRSGQLTTMPAPPLGMESVDNPLPASRGQDADTAEQLQRSGPRFLGASRGLISLTDYRQRAIEFPGIGQAHAERKSDGTILLIVASATGDPVDDSRRALLERQIDAIRPEQPVQVVSCRTIPFDVQARLTVDSRRRWEDVAAAAGNGLAQAFDPQRRQLGAAVLTCDLVHHLQQVPGVNGVELLAPQNDLTSLPHQLRFINAAAIALTKVTT